jgi:RNA-directed DNA polymerase
MRASRCADLSRNLHKLWNRMTSGSYFPPPVKQVEIAKKSGDGKRVLGIPTVADRIGQQVVKARIEGEFEDLFHPDSYGYRLNKSAADAVADAWKLTDKVIEELRTKKYPNLLRR